MKTLLALTVVIAALLSGCVTAASDGSANKLDGK